VNKVYVQGTQWLDAPAASVWYAFRDELFTLTGILPIITRPYGAGRTDADQLKLWQHSPGTAWHPSDPRANHMRGLAFDLDNWMRFPAHILNRLLLKYGLARPFSWEPWHIDATRAPALGAPAGGGEQPFEPGQTINTEGEDDVTVFRLRVPTGGGVSGVCVSVAAGGHFSVMSGERAAQVAKNVNPTGAVIDVNDGEPWHRELDARGIPRELNGTPIAALPEGTNGSWSKLAATGTYIGYGFTV
jgi:hypothetical protein